MIFKTNFADILFNYVDRPFCISSLANFVHGGIRNLLVIYLPRAS